MTILSQFSRLSQFSQCLPRLLAVCGLSLCGLLGSALAGQAAEDGSDSFKVGIAPHTSARVIIEQYQPVRQALEKALGVPVEILTAPDFTEFARRAVHQDYDIAITTGHQARLLEADAGYKPLVTYLAEFKSVTVVPLSSAAKQPHDLDNTTVIGLSPSSLVTIWGQHWLAENKIANFQIRYVSAADSVAQLLLAGDASAGFMSLANFQGLSPETRAQLRFLAESPSMAGRVYMLNGSQAAKHDKIVKALQDFAQTDAGKQYFDSTKLSGYRLIRPGELEAMEPYANEVRQVLKNGK